jgi:dTDP-glucose pyrophosphorylase
MSEDAMNVQVSPDIPVKAALKRMDDAARKILFVVKEDRVLTGVVTDGDVRRWILAGRSLEEPVSAVMNAEPVTLREGFDATEARDVMVDHVIESIPVIDDAGRVVSAIWWHDLFEAKRVKHAAIDVPVVIMAGGEGTRLSPFTKVLPKPLVPLGDKTIVEHIIERFTDHGCRRFYLSVNYKAALIRAYFSDPPHDYEISFVQEDRPLGTAGSLSLLCDEICSTFFVSNCDVLVDADYADVLQFHRDNGNHITLVASMKEFVIPYGVCEITEGGALTRIVEKPDFNHLVSTGIYVLEPDVLAQIRRDERCDITEIINEHLGRGERVGVYPVSERSWMDMGQIDQYQLLLERFGVL